MKLNKKVMISAVLFLVMMVFVGCSSNDGENSAEDTFKIT